MVIFSSLIALALFTGSPQSDTASRRIVLFAHDSNDTRLLEQQNIFRSDAAGLKERQIVVSVITAASGGNEYKAYAASGRNFLFLLYGKDGGKKFTSEKPVSLKQLYGIIDSMPMRVGEINSKQKP